MSDLNIELARFNMIEQQIRPAEVLDQRILDTISATKREQFVPSRLQKLAFSDTAIPLSHGQVMMKPIVEARLLQALDIHPQDKILEIGTGSGYLTALLARLGGHVYSVEIVPELQAQAAATLKSQGIVNVTLESGDACHGWDKHAPYDVVVITGSLPQLPEAFKHNLAVGGRLFAVLGTAPVMEATLITRVADDQWATEDLFETELPVLVNGALPRAFVF